MASRNGPLSLRFQWNILMELVRFEELGCDLLSKLGDFLVLDIGQRRSGLSRAFANCLGDHAALVKHSEFWGIARWVKFNVVGVELDGEAIAVPRLATGLSQESSGPDSDIVECGGDCTNYCPMLVWITLKPNKISNSFILMVTIMSFSEMMPRVMFFNFVV